MEGLELIKHIARDGFVLAAWGKAPKDSRFVVVLRKGSRPELWRVLEALRPAGRPGAEGANARANPKAGRTHSSELGKDGVWWVENGDLIVTAKDKADEILAVLDGKQPSAVLHPLRTALAAAEDGFEPAAVGFLDMAALPPLPT